MSRPLQDSLCSVCHQNAVKYTCPRCSTHTCSLTCVKRHKTWSRCSGIRDPAEYRKRSELATPVSVDKDFNFISSIERGVSRAQEGHLRDDVILEPARSAVLGKRSRLEEELETRQVRIVRAPKGLSRSKDNKTSWASNVKAVAWTVEWLRDGKERLVSQSVETKSVEELYQQAQSGARKRRRRASEATDHGYKLTANGVGDDATVREPGLSLPTDSDPPFFYLYRPDTSARYRCLIPLTPTDFLKDILDARTLLEFPTIYVKHEPPDQLQLPFILEEQYLAQHGDTIPVQLGKPVEDGEILEDTDVEAVAGKTDVRQIRKLLAGGVKEAEQVALADGLN